MRFVILATFLFFGFVLSIDIARRTDIDIKEGVYRRLTAFASPSFNNANRLHVRAARLDVDRNSAALDVAGFTIRTPREIGASDLLYYFAVLEGDANWSINDLSLSASLNEIAAAFVGIFSYKNVDSSPGFQMRPGNDLKNCAAGYDCVYEYYPFSTLTWTSLAVTNHSCPAGAEYEGDCVVYAITTVGSRLGSDVVIFTLKVASQPVLVDSVRLDPNFAKIDVTINFPWTTEPSDAKVGLLGYAGGRATSGNYHAEDTVDNKRSVSWGSSGQKGYYSWEGTAIVNNNGPSAVYVHPVYLQEILDFNPSTIIEGIVYAPIKLSLAIWKGLNWDGAVLFYSTMDDKPTSIYWDPEIGLNTDSAYALVPFFPMLLLIFYAFFY